MHILLEKGELIQDGDQVWQRGRWVKSIYIGMPVVRGVFRREVNFSLKQVEALQDVYEAAIATRFCSLKLRMALSYAKAIR